jgi:uncharacterized protein VirK/YbjX
MRQDMPSVWQGVAWAWRRGAEGGGISRPRLLWRALAATLLHRKALRRWMSVAFELHSRGMAPDLEGEYLRAVRPYVERHTGFDARVVQLIDHVDWLETAFQPAALERLCAGKTVVLAELPPPRGCDFMRLQLRRSSVKSPEGELLLTLTLQRSPEIQHKAAPMDAAVLAFSRFRIDGVGCLVIGGVRGQRHPVLRLSPVELAQALQGWKPSVLMVRVAQELARFWGLRLIGLDPSSHRLRGWTYQWSSRHRDAAERIYESYEALWEHFEATNGPIGWMVLPMNSDEKLEATALSPERRARQTRRADYWIRTRKLLRLQVVSQLQRPGRDPKLTRVTESLGPRTVTSEDDWDDGFMDSSEDLVPSRVLETGPGQLL